MHKKLFVNVSLNNVSYFLNYSSTVGSLGNFKLATI